MSIWTRFLGRSSAVESRPVKPVVVGSIPTVPAISRRSFLVGAAAVAVAAPPVARTFFGPPRGGWPPLGYDASVPFSTDVLRYKAYERYSYGWTDPQAIYGTGFGCDPCEFRKVIEPGVRKVFNEAYENSCQEWERVFADDGVSLNSASHPGSKPLSEEDQVFVEEGGWKCINGHPYCNRCASPVELSEASLEQMMIDIKKTVDPRKLRLDPTKTWYLSPEISDGLKRFERQSPILISPGRRWWK